MYAGDYDDILPRQDGCNAGSALNAALNVRPFNAVGVGCTASPFHYRMNHFSWQKWIMPYMKNVDIFTHPHRGRSNRNTPSCPGGEWSDCGQVTASYALNLSLFGALNTYNQSATATNQDRAPFLGGSMTAIPRPAETALALETGNPNIAFAPTAPVSGDSGFRQINYAPAVRELWVREFYRSTNSCGADNSAPFINSGIIDDVRAPRGGVTIAWADGSAKFLPVGQFLARTPTMAEYGISGTTGAGTCMFPGGTFRISNIPNLNIEYPMWGLGQ
jgi:hypothetical protein